MFKRRMAFFSAMVLLLVCLCGCGDTVPQDTATTTAITTTTTATTEVAGGEETTTTATETVTTTTEKQTTTTEKESTTTAEKTTTTTKEAATTTEKAPVTTTEKKTTTTEATTTTTTTKAPTTTTKAEVITALKPLSPKEYYGYTLLADEAESEKLLYVYNAFVKASEEMAEIVDFESSGYDITPEEIKKVWVYYTLDHPHHFWLTEGYGITVLEGGGVVDVSPEYTMSKSERDRAKAEFDAVVKQLLSNVSGSWDEYHRELAVHDILCDLLTYKDVGKPSYNAYGALTGKFSVCEGYAESFQYLMYQCGIQCLSVFGKAGGGSHKWNIVRINDVYYEVDVTWDDPVVSEGAAPFVVHSYFNISDAILTQDHNIGENNYPLPHCDSKAENYYKIQGVWMDTFSEDVIAQQLKTNNVIELYLNKHTPDQFAKWLGEHWGNILQKAGLTQGGYSFAVVGKGVRLTLTK